MSQIDLSNSLVKRKATGVVAFILMIVLCVAYVEMNDRSGGIAYTYLVLDAETLQPISGVSVEARERGIVIFPDETGRPYPGLAAEWVDERVRLPRIFVQNTDARGRVAFPVSDPKSCRVWLETIPSNYKRWFDEPRNDLAYVKPQGVEQVFFLLRRGSETDKLMARTTQIYDEQKVVCRQAISTLRSTLESEGYRIKNDSREVGGSGNWRSQVAVTAQRKNESEQRCYVEVQGFVGDDWCHNLPMTISHHNKPLDDRFIEILTAALKARNWQYEINTRCKGISAFERTPYATP